MILPDFISNAIINGNTSVGNNKAFGNMCVELTSKLLENRYKQVINTVEKRYGYIPTVEEAQNKLVKTVTKTVEIETPLRDQLETLCKAVTNKTLGVPHETVLLDCKLVDSIEPLKGLRIMPEDDESPEYKFSDISLSKNDEIMKRRLIDSLVQGISYLLMTATYDCDEIKRWAPELPELYAEIICLNDYLLFSKEEEISDKNPMMGAYVLTDIGQPDDKTVIDVQGLVYPLMLQETYRGFFEMFGTHGLPSNIHDAMYIIRKSDFTVAEAWDLRIGVPLWQFMDKMIPDHVETTMYPYIFSTIVQEDVRNFNETIFGLVSNKMEMREWIDNIVNQIKHDREYQLFKKDIERFNLEKCLINDTTNDNDNNIID